MKIKLEYGKTGLSIDVPSENATVLNPEFLPGLKDEAGAFREAVERPIESRPLRELIGPSDKVAVVIPDVTRPLPSDRLLSWLFSALPHVPAGNFTIINGTGSHRKNTQKELESMVGAKILKKYRIVNHNAYKPETLEKAGMTRDGKPVLLNREYVRADKRIILGFIEPHFMAGFSGGYKAVFPGVTGIDSIMHYHRASAIGHPKSEWGVLDGNPTQEQIREGGSLLPVDFCVNVTLNNKREITRFFCGEVLAAHKQGCGFVRSHAMIPCARAFPLVITTNSGYPLDQNLYQTVKGFSVAARIAEPGGLILAAARCNDGFPDHGNFKKLLFEHKTPQDVLNTITAPGFSLYDQWEAQILAMIQIKNRLALYSELDPAEVKRANIEPVADINQFISEELRKLGRDAAVAVMPEGPMTVPCLETTS